MKYADLSMKCFFCLIKVVKQEYLDRQANPLPTRIATYYAVINF